MCLYPISERTLLLQTLSRSVSVSIIQLNNLTHRYLSDILKELPKQDLTIIMGVFNIKGLTGEYIGPHGLGERNERRKQLSYFTAEHEFIVLNIFFKLYTKEAVYLEITNRHRCVSKIYFSKKNMSFNVRVL
jgi:hypothetical protein